MHTAADVLRFLARVVGEGHDPGLVFDVRKDGPVVRPPWAGAAPTDTDQPSLVNALRGAPRWRKVVALHREEQPGRVGHLWLVGRGSVLGERRTICAPLLAQSVDSDRVPPADPYEPTPLADALGLDPDLLAAAAATTPGTGEVTPALRRRMPRLDALVEALRAASVLPDRVVVADPSRVEDRGGLWLCHGAALFIDLSPLGPPTAQRLRAWAGLDVTATALAAVYVPGEEREARPAPVAPDQPRSPMPLNDAQRATVLAARDAPVSVVSGAPGTGKSHASVAIALDTVARGGSVLLATRSTNAADVLADLLDRHPGPTPVRIGGGTTRRELADRLAGGLPPRPGRGDLRAADAAEEEAAARVRTHHGDLARVLAVASGDAVRDPTREALLRTEVPGAFTADNLAEVVDLLAVAQADDEAGWWRRWRAGRAAARARRALGAAGDVPLPRLREAVELGRRRALAAAIADAGGLDPGPTRAALAAAQVVLQGAVGHRLSLATTGAADRDGRRAVAGLAAALRSGPRRRATQLARLDSAALTRTLPLWVGTVTEIEQLLPRTPAMFDLVVLDEASQLDQLVAAPVLARAARAVVTGDPKQLRHVSFVADADVDAALEASGLAALADRLDVRRISAFDAAAAVAPVRWLDEHLRSVPHLIRFSADRFYDEHLHVVTTHPSVATTDAIDTVHVEHAGGDSAAEVVTAEVAAVLDELATIAAADHPGSVGVVTPFRAQADALQSAIIDALDLATIERLDLRVGTVHGFQGGERDTVLLSLGLTEDDPPQRRTFAQDPHLVNVMVTRARRRIVVVTALPSDTSGLLGSYLQHAERPPGPPVAREPRDHWTRALLDELRRQGYAARPGADRRHGVDLVVGEGAAAVGLLTQPHPDGVDADVARHAALVRAGWDLVELYTTPVDDDPVQRVVDLASRLPRTR